MFPEDSHGRLHFMAILSYRDGANILPIAHMFTERRGNWLSIVSVISIIIKADKAVGIS